MRLLPGIILDPCSVANKIGKGGMRGVYRASYVASEVLSEAFTAGTRSGSCPSWIF